MAFYKWNTSGELTWSDGDVLTAADLNGSIDETTPPIGAVLPWLKSFTSVPQTLPTGWVECDGSVISDADSPLNGQTLPDLNGDGRFLKGAATSGTETAAATHNHKFTQGGGSGGNIDIAGAANWQAYNSAGALQNFDSPHVSGNNYTIKSAGGDPINYTVVFIIRIK